MLETQSDPAPVHIDIVVESDAWPHERELRTLAHRCLGECRRASTAQVTPGAELCLVFTDDAAISELNRQWRGVGESTNVLSFPAAEPGDAPMGPLLGDIVVAHERVAREAIAEGKPFEHHLSHLIVHGILHLFGYDHLSEDDASEMENLERHILAIMDIPDPYGIA